MKILWKRKQAKNLQKMPLCEQNVKTVKPIRLLPKELLTAISTPCSFSPFSMTSP